MARGLRTSPGFDRLGDALPRVLRSLSDSRTPAADTPDRRWPSGNWTKFPNALLEALIGGRFNLAQARLLSFVVRGTLGWLDRKEGRRKWTRPITQLELADRLAVGRTALTAAIKSLASESVIVIKREPHTTRRSYQLNQAWIDSRNRPPTCGGSTARVRRSPPCSRKSNIP